MGFVYRQSLTTTIIPHLTYKKRSLFFVLNLSQVSPYTIDNFMHNLFHSLLRVMTVPYPGIRHLPPPACPVPYPDHLTLIFAQGLIRLLHGLDLPLHPLHPRGLQLHHRFLHSARWIVASREAIVEGCALQQLLPHVGVFLLGVWVPQQHPLDDVPAVPRYLCVVHLASLPSSILLTGYSITHFHSIAPYPAKCSDLSHR